MNRRFVAIWCCNLKLDWFSLRQPALCNLPFVLVAPDHGRMIITATNTLAQTRGIDPGMPLADARAIVPGLQVQNDPPALADKLLKQIARWCIRFTPVAAIDAPDGLLLEATGCSHLWGGDEPYLKDMANRFAKRGYTVRIAMADTIGTAWAVARFGKQTVSVVKNKEHGAALLPLPPAALRLETEISERLHKLGLHTMDRFIHLPPASLKRRFGAHFMQRLNQALGYAEENIQPLYPPAPYAERLPCLELIVTLKGIEIALQQLLQNLCNRLLREEKGLRTAIFKGYRVDGEIQEVSIGTHRPSRHAAHLFKLFALKLQGIAPGLGIELFVLEAPRVETLYPAQEKLWAVRGGLEDTRISELIDRLTGRLGEDTIRRYLPAEHYWPERSIQAVSVLRQKATTAWSPGHFRPIRLLARPEPVEITAPVPDYPPMLFRYKGKLHTITRADGPERIEPEWWLQPGRYRDYYRVEDEQGGRYWLFRLGDYTSGEPCQWFIHGFFA